MRHEVNRAYPRLTREWPGRVIRMHLPYLRGFPDFLLLWRGVTVYTEVKWLPDRLRPAQAHLLQELHEEGYHTAALGWDDEQRGWLVRRGGYRAHVETPLRWHDGLPGLRVGHLGEAAEFLVSGSTGMQASRAH